MTTLRQLADAEPRAAELLTQVLMGHRRAQALLLLSAHESRAEGVATAFVKALLCPESAGRDACGTCGACKKLAADSHPNVVTPPIGARGLSIDGVRALCRKMALTGQGGGLKVARIAGVSRMGIPAQNALLKTLEEPQGDTCFVLTGSRLRTILPTVRSRVQMVRLHGSSELDAQASLRAQGVSESVVCLAALASGDDAEAAKRLGDAGVLAFTERFEALLVAGDDAQAITRLAVDYGQDASMSEAALLVLEATLRDAMAAASGSAADVFRLPALARLARERGGSQLGAASDAVLAWRALGATPINRSLALESIFHLLLQKP